MARAIAEEVVELKFEITFAVHLFDRLAAAARTRERVPVSLLAEIIETVLAEDLFDAILDDAPHAKKGER